MNGRVLFVTAEYPPMRGGVGDYTEQLVAAVQALSWDARVLTSRAAAGNPDERVLAWVPRWRWGSAGQVQRAARQASYDVVHIQYQTGAYEMHPAINFLPARLHRALSGLPVVTTYHDLLTPYLFPKAGRVRGWVNRGPARDSDAVVVTNRRDGRELSRTPRIAAKLTMVPIGSNLPDVVVDDRLAMRRRFGILPDEFAVGFFGFLTEDKGIDLLITALERISLRPLRLVVIGGGLAETDVANAVYHRRVVEQMGRAAIPITRTGHLPAGDAAAALQAVDLIALPFRSGASLRRGTLIAAVRSGTPVLASDPDDAESLEPLRSGESIWLVPSGEVDPLVDGLRTLIQDAPLRDRLARRALDVAPAFNWSTIARKHVDLYRELIATAGDRRGPD